MNKIEFTNTKELPDVPITSPANAELSLVYERTNMAIDSAV